MTICSYKSDGILRTKLIAIAFIFDDCKGGNDRRIWLGLFHIVNRCGSGSIQMGNDAYLGLARIWSRIKTN